MRIKNGFVEHDISIDVNGKSVPAIFRRNIVLYLKKLHRCAICGCQIQNCPCSSDDILKTVHNKEG
jgi:hypothetical protein